jgi:ATP-binding cassette subfamily B multidrug efflux pump
MARKPDIEQSRSLEPAMRGIGSTPMGRGGGGGGTGGPFGGMFDAAAKPKDAKMTLRRLMAFLGPHVSSLTLVFVLVLVSSGLSLLASRMIGIAIDRYIVPGDLAGLARHVAWLVLVYLVANGSAWLQTFIMAGVSQRVVKELRRQLFAHIQRLPMTYFDGRTRGEIMSRLANDVETVSQTLSTSATLVFSSVVTVVGALAAMLALSPLMALVTLVSVPLATVLARRIASHSRGMFRQRQQHLGRLNGLIEESVTGHRVVQAYGQETNILREFAAVNDRLRQAGTAAETWSGMVRPLMTVVSSISFGALAVMGGLLVLRGRMRIGRIASFMQYNKQFSGPVNALATQFNTLQSAIAGLERVYEVLDEAPETEDQPGAVSLENVAGDVQFQDVIFGYRPDKMVLRDVSLHAEPGRTIAIVGPTGAGKTTLVNLLMRFYDVGKGSIALDGHDVRSVTRDSLRHAIGVVLQDTYLFAESVRDNIRYGRLDASEEEIIAAAKLTGADSFIQRLPGGYATVLTEEGANLSQGQRQLLSITRAVLANPRVLILDEATSSVDTLTELKVQKAMLKLMKGRTSFVIAHRLSTIRSADEIVFMDDGRIVERGNHQQLLDLKGRYASLYYSQFHREEMVRQAATRAESATMVMRPLEA